MKNVTNTARPVNNSKTEVKPLKNQFRPNWLTFWGYFTINLRHANGSVKQEYNLFVIMLAVLAVFTNNVIFDYLYWFTFGHHLPVIINVFVGIALGYFSTVVVLAGLVAFTFQHLLSHYFLIPLFH